MELMFIRDCKYAFKGIDVVDFKKGEFHNITAADAAVDMIKHKYAIEHVADADVIMKPSVEFDKKPAVKKTPAKKPVKKK